MPPLEAEDIDAEIELEPAGSPPAGKQNEARGPKPSEGQPEGEGGEPGDELDEDGNPRTVEEPELVEIDRDGKKLRIPKELKDDLLRQSDYSRHMAGLKTDKEKLEAERKAFRETSEAERRIHGQLANVDHQLTNFVQGPGGKMVAASQIDWVAWQAADPKAAQTALLRFQALDQQKRVLSQQAGEARQKHETEANREFGERLRATREFAEKEIPGWTPEMDKELTQLAVSNGVSPEQLQAALTPGLYKLLHRAHIGEKYLAARAKKAATATQDNRPEPPARVGQRKSGGTGVLSDRMSTADWIAQRNRKVASR